LGGANGIRPVRILSLRVGILFHCKPLTNLLQQLVFP
jgi:hypothetical protein